MTNILWDGNGIYRSGEGVVTAPCLDCCCTGACVIPDYGCTDDQGDAVDQVSVECTGLCSESTEADDCRNTLSDGLLDQQWALGIEDDCCSCNRDYSSYIIACCTGTVRNEIANIEYYPVGSGCDTSCTIVEGSSHITTVEISGVMNWRIPLCGDPPATGIVYCVEEP